MPRFVPLWNALQFGVGRLPVPLGKGVCGRALDWRREGLWGYAEGKGGGREACIGCCVDEKAG